MNSESNPSSSLDTMQVASSSPPQSTQSEQSQSRYEGYPKIGQDVPVDRYIQQMPPEAGLNEFFSLFLPNAEFDTTPQNPLK